MNIFNKIFNKKKNKVHFYVVRDNNGDLNLWMGKPQRASLSKLWYGYNEVTWIATSDLFHFYGINSSDFDNLKWEDEPVEVFLNMEK